MRSPGSSFFPMWFLMRSCDDELLFLYRRDGRGGHIPTNPIEVVCACIFVTQIYIHISYIINRSGGTPVLTTSHLVRLNFSHLEPEFFVFFDRTTDRLRWGFYTPRMPAAATMGGICGSLCWTCGSERAREAKIEVLCHPRTDHFSRSLKGSRLYAREVTINDARGQ